MQKLTVSTKSAKTKLVIKDIEKVADTETSVLIKEQTAVSLDMNQIQ